VATGREKRKFDKESHGKPYYMKYIQQMEGRRQRLDDLRESILMRQRDESEALFVWKYTPHMYEKYFHSQTTCTV
jgi:hypothetical protein